MKKDNPITLNKKALRIPMKVEHVVNRLSDSSTVDITTMYMNDVGHVKKLTKKELCEWKNSKKFHNKVVESNLRLVVKIAKSYQNRGLPLLDLINEGNLGLIKAASKFDASKNCKFSTYSVWWIKQYIDRAIMNQSKLIRLPVYLQKEINQVMYKIREMQLQEDFMSEQELIESLGISSEDYKNIIDNNQQDIFNIETLPNLNQQILDSDGYEPEALLEDYDYQVKLQEAVMSLPSTMKKIIILRFGLFDFKPMTLEAVGEKLNLSREKVRRLQLEAIAYLEKELSDCDLN